MVTDHHDRPAALRVLVGWEALWSARFGSGNALQYSWSTQSSAVNALTTAKCSLRTIQSGFERANKQE